MDKNNRILWLPICMIFGAGVGTPVHQIPIGLCFGIAIGAVLSFKKKK